MAQDDVARALIERHIEDCDKKMARIETMFNQLWSAVNMMRNRWLKVAGSVILLLVTLNLGLIGYLWRTNIIP